MAEHKQHTENLNLNTGPPAAEHLPAQAEPDFSAVPGVAIAHSPQSGGRYIGSPGIAVLPNGDYVASHDLFGPESGETSRGVTRVFGSSDGGCTWRHLSDINGQFWSTLFVHHDDLYVIGTFKQYGNMIIRKSTDGGCTWTEPKDGSSGLLLEGRYHCAPVPTLVHDGLIRRAMEDACGPRGWPGHFRCFMMTAPVDADLLNRASWMLSKTLGSNPDWLDRQFGGWLEGNAVLTPQGDIVDILRVHCPGGGKAAVVHISTDGKDARFNPATDIIEFPGGAKKFTIRYDPHTQRYWSLTNYVPAKHAGGDADLTRNTLALASSVDLHKWKVNCILLYHHDRLRHAFQYPDWLFDGDDIIAAIRTAHDDGLGGAHSAHDANFLTFHRFSRFRGQEKCAESCEQGGRERFLPTCSS